MTTEEQLLARSKAKWGDRADPKPVTPGQGQALIPVPPHNTEAERAVLAACMVDTTVAQRVVTELRVHDFYHEAHQIVFDAVAALIAASRGVDRLTVANQIGSARLDAIGGMIELIKMMSELDTLSDISNHIEIIRSLSIKRRLIALGTRTTQDGYDVTVSAQDATARVQNGLNEVVKGYVQHKWSTIREILDEGLREELYAFARNPGEALTGIPTGIASLDDHLVGGGLVPGKTYVIAAMTSMGKSSLMRHILLNIALRGTPVGLISLEQRKKTVAEELVWSMTGIDSRVHARKNIPFSPEEIELLEWADQSLSSGEVPLHVVDTAGMQVPQILAAVDELRTREPDLSVVGVDYLQIISSVGTAGSQEERMKVIMQSIRDGLENRGITSMLASQLNRQVAKPGENPDFTPKLEHLRSSGTIGEDAFCVLGLFFPDYFRRRGIALLEDQERYIADEDGNEAVRLTNEMRIIILKQQTGEAGDRISISFYPETRQFLDKVPEGLE